MIWRLLYTLWAVGRSFGIDSPTEELLIRYKTISICKKREQVLSLEQEMNATVLYPTFFFLLSKAHNGHQYAIDPFHHRVGLCNCGLKR